MTIEAIRLHNFMAFADTDWIELKPISLLFGKNSSGKSAIIRSLLLLRQSVEASDKTGKPLVFLSIDGVDSGSFVETVHRHDTNRAMVFRLRFRLQDLPEDKKKRVDELKEKINERREQHGKAPIKPDDPLNWLEVSLSFRWTEEGKTTEEKITADPTAIRLDAPWPWLEGQERVTIFGLEKLLDEEAVREAGREWWLWSDVLINPEEAWPPLNLKSSERGFWPVITDPKVFLNHPESKKFEFVSDLLEATRQVVTNFLTSFKYLGPLRPEPERLYAKNKPAVIEWQQRGWGAFADFLRYEADQVDFEKIDYWLQQLGLGYRINPPAATEISSRELAVFGKVTLQETKQADPINLKDVGFGTSQVLPVIIQSVLARKEKDTLVIIEQPELHLHPNAQAELGDLFVQSTENGVRFFIETHSEHIVLRIQRRIRKVATEPWKTFVMYVTRNLTTTESFVHRLRLDKEGDFIDRWPEGFFDQDYKEVFDLQ